MSTENDPDALRPASLHAEIVSLYSRVVTLGDQLREASDSAAAADRRVAKLWKQTDGKVVTTGRRVDDLQARLDRAMRLIYCLSAAVFGLAILVALT